MRLTRRVTLGIAFALLLTGCSGRSAPAARAPTSSPPSTIRFASGEAARGIPFRLVDDQIVLAVTINDSLTLDMVLDTGMPIDGAMLLDPKLGERLGLRYVRQIPLGGGGSEGPNLAGVVRTAEENRVVGERAGGGDAFGPEGSEVAEADRARGPG